MDHPDWAKSGASYGLDIEDLLEVWNVSTREEVPLIVSPIAMSYVSSQLDDNIPPPILQKQNLASGPEFPVDY